MRLDTLKRKLRPLQKLLLRFVRLYVRYDPGPVITLSYRRELFGRHFAACMQQGMRGATCWSRGECELFAAFISRLNSCHY